jgi:hypothetical protein
MLPLGPHQRLELAGDLIPLDVSLSTLGTRAANVSHISIVEGIWNWKGGKNENIFLFLAI